MKKFRRAIAIALPLFILYGFFLFLRASDDPKFCASCHYMQQYYDNWLTSSHNQISCGKCHYAPGLGNYLKGKLRLASEIVRYYIGAYSPEVTSKISDGACLQCHKTQDFYKTIEFDRGKITFSHQVHLSSKKVNFSFKCQTCHSQLVQGKHGGVSTQICVLCHFDGSDMRGGPVGGCNTCHGPPQNDIYVWDTPFNHSKYLKSGVECQTCHLHVTTGTGSVTRDKCLECHVSVADTFPDRKSIHEEHVGKDNIKCFKCHGEIKHGRIEMYDVFSPDCQQCHGNRHSTQEMVFSGSGGTNVPVIPDPMFLADVTCEGCHSSMAVGTSGVIASQNPTQVDPTRGLAKLSTCSTCHGGNYDKLMIMWQDNVKARIQKLELAESRNYLFTGRKPAQDKNLDLVLKDGSYGAHNNRYVNLLLDQTEKQLKVVDKKPGVEFLYERNSACLTCHFGIENLSVNVKGETFPHGSHLFTRRCVDCHQDASPSSANHGKLAEKATSCTNCHHESKDTKCETCHSLQSDFYNGKFLAASPDTMAASGIACSDCHLAEGNYPSIPTTQVCSSCHDEAATKKYEAEIIQVENAISQWNRIFPEMVAYYKSKQSKETLDTLRAIESDLEKVEEEGSMGVHNLGFTQGLIRRATTFVGSFKSGSDSRAGTAQLSGMDGR